MFGHEGSGSGKLGKSKTGGAGVPTGGGGGGGGGDEGGRLSAGAGGDVVAMEVDPEDVQWMKVFTSCTHSHARTNSSAAIYYVTCISGLKSDSLTEEIHL